MGKVSKNHFIGQSLLNNAIVGFISPPRVRRLNVRLKVCRRRYNFGGRSAGLRTHPELDEASMACTLIGFVCVSRCPGGTRQSLELWDSENAT